MAISLYSDFKVYDEQFQGAFVETIMQNVDAFNEASQGAEDGGRTAMENLLAKNPDINVVYTINEPAAYGA